MTTRSPYLVSAGYDWTWFLLPPLVGLVLGILIAGTPLTEHRLIVDEPGTTIAAIAIGALIHAHLVAVFFRSHANPSIFRRYPIRFLVVPPLLWLAIASTPWIAITSTVVVTFWDVWHSGAQTFGFARIYDRNAGNPPELGRRFDYWLNQLLYAGPILAGATLLDHVDVFDDYRDIDATFFASVPAYAEGSARTLSIVVITAGTIFIAAYLGYYALLRRRGYRVPFLKVFLLATTGLCSIYTWGFNTWGQAFFIMNFFHAVQYLALVWAMEKKTMAKRFRIRAPFAAFLFFGSIATYGIWAELLDPDIHTLWAATIVVSLMHFWYDGFIWSVRRNEV